MPLTRPPLALAFPRPTAGRGAPDAAAAGAAGAAAGPCGAVDEGDAHAWLDDELEPAAARALAAHLHACAACRAHVDALAAFLGALRQRVRGRGERAPERLRALVRALAAGDAAGA